MKYNVNDTIRIITDDTSGYGKGYIGKITGIDGDTDTMVCCSINGKYEYANSTTYYEVDGKYEYVEAEIELVKPSRIRGFEAIKGWDDIPLPTRATKHSAGYDIVAAVDIFMIPNSIAMVPTGLKVYMANNEWLGIYLRSSIAKNLGLSMANDVAVIDSDYYDNPSNEGHIHVMLRNNNADTVHIKAGQRIAQGIFHTYLCTDDDNVTTDRIGGVGSSGK